MKDITEKSVLENVFCNKVLRSIGESECTAQQIRDKYVYLFPPPLHRFRESLGISVSVKRVGLALNKLAAVGLVIKKPGRPLKYCISNTGRPVVAGKKKS